MSAKHRQTHDTMKLHGYAPDSETFVSLLAGAAQQEDAALARRLYLKMREQLITATPKVYATLMQAAFPSNALKGSSMNVLSDVT